MVSRLYALIRNFRWCLHVEKGILIDVTECPYFLVDRLAGLIDSDPVVRKDFPMYVKRYKETHPAVRAMTVFIERLLEACAMKHVPTLIKGRPGLFIICSSNIPADGALDTVLCLHGSASSQPICYSRLPMKTYVSFSLFETFLSSQ